MKLVILDRDGLVYPLPPKAVMEPSTWSSLGSLEALSRLHRAGWHVVVTTYQPELGGPLSMETLSRIHGRLCEVVRMRGGEIEAIVMDDSADRDVASTGLYDEVAERFKINLNGVPIVCMDWDQVAAARAAGGTPVRIGDYPEDRDAIRPAQIYPSLAAFTEALLGGQVT